MRLGDATWPEVDGIARRRTDSEAPAPIVLIPVGSTEQHGPHLPLATDTIIAEELAGRAVHHTDGLMVGPTISVWPTSPTWVENRNGVDSSVSAWNSGGPPK